MNARRCDSPLEPLCGGFLHIGETHYSGGRAGDQPAVGSISRLEKLGLKLGRLKTGTPPRINKRSIDYRLYRRTARRCRM